ncbi:hypothetical protein OAH36_01310 [Verrucomicrobia bacterium]|jgi:hypothetical protein|nr:hypothetical protein [Verrucomicrobiota bacterium]
MTDRYQSISNQRLLKHRKKKQAEKTGLDYLVTALSPLLIMLLVGSLVFFLIEVFYRGEMEGGIRWVMFWFVGAIVLVARIGIEQSPGHAAIYGAALAGATWFFLMMTHPAFLLGIVLLALVWWSSHKLVRDCTLIDDQDDSSDKGLLEKANVIQKPHGTIDQSKKSNHRKRKTAKPTKEKHSPGRWLVYYSLAALPLFGIGQLFLNHSPEGTSNQSGFLFLTLYLVATAGLLLSTSFLGLRRYLRQRALKMPEGIASKWLFSGTKVACIVFLIAWLFPRPGTGMAWSGLSAGIEHSIQQASQVAMKFNPAGTGEGSEKAGGKREEDAQDQSQANAKKTESPNEAGSKPSPQNKGGATGESEKEEETTSQSDASSPSFSWLVKLLLGLAVLVLIYRNRASLIAIMKQIWITIMGFFESLGEQRRTKKKQRQGSEISIPTGRHSFKSYRDPFKKGNHRNWPNEALVAYTYEALESWADKEGSPAASNQTPLERVRQITTNHPSLGTAAINLGEQYSLLAYRKHLPKDFDVESLKQLWLSMK